MWLLVSTARRIGAPMAAMASCRGRACDGVSRVSTTVAPSSSTTRPALARPCPLGCCSQADTPGASSTSTAVTLSTACEAGPMPVMDVDQLNQFFADAFDGGRSYQVDSVDGQTLTARQPVESLMLRPGGTVSGPTQM